MRGKKCRFFQKNLPEVSRVHIDGNPETLSGSGYGGEKTTEGRLPGTWQTVRLQTSSSQVLPAGYENSRDSQFEGVMEASWGDGYPSSDFTDKWLVTADSI